MNARAQTDITHGNIDRVVIGAAIRVHQNLGPGFPELMYENALCWELDKLGVRVDKQLEVRVVYQDEIEIGVHRLDLLVDDRLIVELKAVRAVDAIHYATVRSYLKATGLSEALILNFGRERLDVRRVELMATPPRRPLRGGSPTSASQN